VDVLKPALFALMASVMFVMWLNRGYVLDAYTEDERPNEIRLSGVASLDFEKTSLPASPYVVHVGEDTRRRPMALLFTDNEDLVAVAMRGGETKIEGTVIIDGQPAVGGTVRLERHTSSGTGVRDLFINAEGRFSARDLPGGRYRVRAWLPGIATMTTSDVFFAESDSDYRRSYSLERIQSEPIIEFANGGTMYVGMTGSFGASVTQHRVDNDGIIVTRPVSGAFVSARFTDYVRLLSSNGQTTDDQGLVVFRLRCERAGSGSVMVTFGEQVIPVALPDCLTAPPTTPTTLSSNQPAAGASGGPSTSSVSSTRTPTTRPGSGGSGPTTTANGSGNGG